MSRSVRSQARSLLVPALAVVLLAGCSLFDADSPPPPTLGPAPTAPIGGQPQEPGPAAATPVPPAAVHDVTWVMVDPPATSQTPELELPLADVVPDVEPVWRLFVVEGELAEPRQIQQSGRWLRAPVWHQGGGSVTVPYFTRVDGPPGYTFGYQELEIATGIVGWDLRLMEPNWYLSPDGSRFFIEDTSGGAAPFLRGVFYVSTPGGETLRLDGFVAEDFRGWSPDGRFFIASGFAGAVTTPEMQSRDHYLIEPGGGEAVLIGRSSQGSGLSTSWSPDSSTIAFTEGEDLVLFEVASRKRTVISLGLEITAAPAWSNDGRYVAAGDGVVDVDSASVLVMPQTEFVLDAGVSSDASFLAVTINPFDTCDELQDNQTMLTDVAAGERRVLHDCDGSGVDFRIDWVAPDSFVLLAVDCYACDGSGAGVSLVRLPDGNIQELTNGRENRGGFSISPDRSRILVGGEKLRLYDATGVLLRVIEPPAGYVIAEFSWSQDGSSFAYVVGPATVNLL